ncbi:MAG: cyclic nucleotide-binding domain-containing protein [Desulfovibrio sp.]|nr:cyclic nucleotide-binding domain-containing protein [Desulfovibrio sp.]MBI4961611.1 cyclic nucleotide-binding domain-containing protein [Desulfovibrio sp.]
MIPKLELLRKIPFFSAFPDDATLEAFVNEGHWAKLGSGSVVYRVGDSANKIYIVLGGKIRITRNNKVLTTLGPGDIFGEVGPFLNIARTVTAVSMGDAILFEFEKAVLDRVPIEIRYNIMKFLYIITTKRFVETTRKITLT